MRVKNVDVFGKTVSRDAAKVRVKNVDVFGKTVSRDEVDYIQSDGI